ncbi:hypothetical protein EV421DRAFT_1903862 [Armillaria borealis]|uniref:Uncharacterized protein n=1 Tax=Armillaria borealis TaxID=47425 RepID=A0AA39JI72_9AGAR|nr:hypothetical protein EV421DRAFT_1903862 [Armillaria borealis]
MKPVQVEGRHALIVVGWFPPMVGRLINVFLSSSSPAEGEGSAEKGYVQTVLTARQFIGLWNWSGCTPLAHDVDGWFASWLGTRHHPFLSSLTDPFLRRERSLKVTKLGRFGAHRRRGAGSRAKVWTDTEGRTTRDERCLGS